ncbi:hypothetical protein J0S82_004257 [Galemys pyrenaicus]|uniref:Uncharacterized protein n=1 Tax=Galemys pyrenaicus TaxID=202257 RepID=A0A8J6DDW9_GALPY|nr:hypothetical protein J0S82_004257 [Galemys pyrenaicus]
MVNEKPKEGVQTENNDHINMKVCLGKERVCQGSKSDSNLTGMQLMKQTLLHSWKWWKKI